MDAAHPGPSNQTAPAAAQPGRPRAPSSQSRSVPHDRASTPEPPDPRKDPRSVPPRPLLGPARSRPIGTADTDPDSPHASRRSSPLSSQARSDVRSALPENAPASEAQPADRGSRSTDTASHPHRSSRPRSRPRQDHEATTPAPRPESATQAAHRAREFSARRGWSPADTTAPHPEEQESRQCTRSITQRRDDS